MSTTRTPRAAAGPGPGDPVFAQRYRAVCSRDQRFDGQFITGVHSTGIYCRPSCPAATPNPGNVSFFLTAAAAHEAGLRACKRCLPDAVPGSPAWNMRDDLAARAMRLIGDGAIERDGVPGLAGQLGYTPRHLTRVLVSELGAGPLALARAHRAQTARILLINTTLSMTDVAFTAGFGSVRQFNETIAAVYERTPSALRQSTSRERNPDRGDSDAHGTTITLQLPARAPFDGRGLLRFLGVRAIAGVETATAQRYARTVRLPHGPATVELSLAGTAAAPVVTCAATLNTLADLAPLVGRVRRLLDLDADSAAIDLALRADPQLEPSVRVTPGIRVPGTLDPEETLFRALIGQQVSVAAARTALTRLTHALGDTLAAPDGGFSTDGAPTLLFPTSARIAAEGRDVLRGPAVRINTIVRVAADLERGDLVLSYGDTRTELEAKLTALPGIGPWTAGYVALRVLGTPDILLTSDLAIRQGASRLGLPGERRALAVRGREWAPWRSYAGMHLWRAASAPVGIL
ncbi:DNA-3-methyladenine glycosylase 2 family protein [Cryobacterium psychrophilum]|uniref:DNA-3-methyladenine glycosylase II n=1 Tax=Cryobacterium psychrophilum TaxID=41988 RepID=A0A4Y8KND7_9MICO|nr:AlkA N-terminal domain-containing protein [Cryobacterium psychrophilum]TDW29081.1 DNA-3-methyladenine glycosylase II [Cryobacterium psychrophilum]TFD79707.1 DNA-3-methyladenine glycosylase 2 family protein [Cryobacterium psychrophilum]